jgi:hypothetical protein
MTTQKFDLDALEHDGDVPDPFVVSVGGRDYELPNPKDIDFRDLVDGMRAFNAGDPLPIVEVLVDEDDRAEFFENKLPMWKLEKMFEQYYKHFGLPSPGKSKSSRRS